MSSVYERLRDRLNSNLVPFIESRHAPVFTSEEASAIRGVGLESGAKALVLNPEDRFVLWVLPADQKLETKRARKAIGTKGLRFATAEELLVITTLKPGSVPPFGSLFQLQTFLDEKLREESTIYFNAGDHSITFQMQFEDYLKEEKPTVVPV
jgi:Ala-tRNA(Pro) deacylase